MKWKHEKRRSDGGNGKKIARKSIMSLKKKKIVESMGKLRSIGLAQEQDSAFIHAVVRVLYDGNINVLSKKTTTCRLKGETKEPISPNKKKTS